MMALALGVVACGQSAPVEPCGQIPEGGCPVGRGGTCKDPTCSGTYDCEGGEWTLLEACMNGSSSSSGLPSTSSSTGSGQGGSCGVTFDFGGLDTSGCVPDLETPDCPVLAAETCSACEGCEDFFVCWSVAADCAPAHAPCWLNVAYCDADGSVVHTAF